MARPIGWGAAALTLSLGMFQTAMAEMPATAPAPTKEQSQKMQMDAAKAGVIGQRNHPLCLSRIEIVDLISHRRAHPPNRAVMVEQFGIALDDDPFADIFGRIAEQIVHLRPHPLFLGE